MAQIWIGADNQYLRDFQDNEKTIPTILTTSQKLSTGVDARNVRNIVLLRPVTTMIEFKQIIGRGTRLYDGKDYFTIYDFVRAHQLFNDPEWDGDPVAPTPPPPPPPPGPPGPPVPPPPPPPPRPDKVVVKLADGKARAIQSMTATSFWSADGRPMSAAQFLESLYGALPSFFKDEEELRQLWQDPMTRKQLLAGLAERGFDSIHLAEMQKLVDAEQCDLFDVLAYVAFAAGMKPRVDRADAAKAAVAGSITDKQKAFVDFVLDQYTTRGVGELDLDNLSPLLKLKYGGAISDALADLGKADQVRGLFAGFQQHLYGKLP